mmetsp:Transcript_20147/g.64730  ORF Transcript_20147/g.64730 Transcript_20147/m.64730 type:complete len:80 (+) Transcript_20147:203-442(+)
MVGCANGNCPGCRIKRDPHSSKEADCSGDGFDHYEEWCCNCLRGEFNWRYYDDDACRQCKARADAAAPRPAPPAPPPES